MEALRCRQFSGPLESLSLSEPEVNMPAARSWGTRRLFLTQCPLNKCGIGTDGSCSSHYPSPQCKCTHTLQWPPRGDPGS